MTASGGAVTVAFNSGQGTSQFVMTLSRAITFGETVTIAYTNPGNGVEDLAQNDMANFSGKAVTNNSTQGQTVSTPVITLPGGTYTSVQSTTITCATPGAAIHYTTDGSAPTGASPLYSGAVGIPSTITIRAIGTLSGWNNSAIATSVYTLNLPPPVNPPSARYIGLRGVPASGGAAP